MDEGFEIVEFLNGVVLDRGLDYVIGALTTHNSRHSGTHTDLRIMMQHGEDSARLLLIGKPIPPIPPKK